YELRCLLPQFDAWNRSLSIRRNLESIR
ncbi:hypothetical protein HID58_029050, partial [Brassica napus]